jgi:hypothetical protein
MVALLEVICHEMQHGLYIMNPKPMMHQMISKFSMLLRFFLKGDFFV